MCCIDSQGISFNSKWLLCGPQCLPLLPPLSRGGSGSGSESGWGCGGAGWRCGPCRETWHGMEGRGGEVKK